jgi:hypothetical protein
MHNSCNGLYYYDGKHDYFCGIKVIDVDEQIDYIKRAVEMQAAKNSNQQHQLNYNKYETVAGDMRYGAKTDIIKNKPEGYCKTQKHGVRHSLTPFSSHSCGECLASFLIHARETSPGVKLLCAIGRPDNEPAQNIEKYENISVKITKGICELKIGMSVSALGSTGSVIKISDFELMHDASTKKLVLVIPECYIKRSNTWLYGETMVSLIGIPICESILTGDQCLAINNDNESADLDFAFNSVPAGYPAWAEVRENVIRSNHKNYVGQIWVHLKCKKCRDKNNISIVNLTEQIKRLTDMINHRDKIIQELLAETYELRSTIVEITTTH